ncbi:hypothetical protein ACGFQG_32115 [Nocardia fluminea]|uniref:hypothetical protein n=1 Tax=Nocardia fluminea TaxID=134984 RepID=UPI003714343E
MEKRNGVWSSQSKASDADDIQRWARKILNATTDPEIERLAKKIKRAAEDLERDLRR